MSLSELRSKKNKRIKQKENELQRAINTGMSIN